MRRRILALIVLVGAIVGALVLRDAIVPEAVRERLEVTLGAWIGTPVHLTGAVETHLMPSPGLRWTRAAVVDAHGVTRLDADEIELSIAAMPLLRGHVEVAGVTLRGARARIALADLPRPTAWPERLAALPPLDLRFEAATLTLETAPGTTDTVDQIDARLVRTAGNGRFDLEVQARLRGESVALDASLPTEPAASARWRIEAAAPGAHLKAGGTRTPTATLGLAGTVSLEVPEAARFAGWAGFDQYADLIRAPLRLDATLASTPTVTTLTNLHLSLADAAASGSLAVTHGAGEPALSGTLAFDTLDFGSVEPLLGDGWKAIPLDRSHLAPALDLRLSARRLKTARVELSNVGASLNLAAGRLNAEIGEATVWGRPVSAVVVGDIGIDGLSGRLRAVAKDLPAAEVGTLFEIEGVEAGSVGIGFEGEAVCARLGDCVTALAGRLRLSARNLAVTGNSPFGDVTRFHPIVVAPKGASRKAIWTQAEADVHLQRTDARIDALEMTSADARFALRGVGNLVTGAVDLAGHAFFRNQRATPPGTPAEEIRIPLSVRGTLHKLEVTPAMPEQIPQDPVAVPLAPILIIPPIAAPSQ